MDAAVKELVRRRAADICEYCRLPQQWSPDLRLQIEHIIPLKHHGGHENANLALACADCNLHKGPNIAGIDPLSLRMTELFNPRQHQWHEHFEEIDGQITGKSAIGRTTVDVLNMNSTEQVEVRLMIAILPENPIS
ncbi:MAG: HNH endonuclease [Pirellulaceae bacterium]|nr:HNH endonuclease [Pirellulaceae bacterium]